MAGTRKAERNEYAYAERVAARVRANVAEQLRELVCDADGMGSRGEFVLRVQNVVATETRIEQAIGQGEQARQEGLPLAPSVSALQDARAARRQAVAELAKACALWCAAMDFEATRDVDLQLNGRAAAPAKKSGEPEI